MLVGKVTPKGETNFLLRKTLRAILEKKLRCSRYFLRTPSGVYGMVIDAQVYSREGSERDERLSAIIEDKRRKQKDLSVEQNAIKTMS